MSTTSSSTSTGALSAQDQLEILNLYARYNFTIDFGDGDGWAATFTPDAVFEGPGMHVVGSDELAAFAKQGHEAMGGRGRHFISNVWAEATEGGARGGAYLVHWFVADDDHPTTTVNTTGIYTDQLVKHDGQWRFSARNFVSG
jgi:SnoaL-like domain